MNKEISEMLHIRTATVNDIKAINNLFWQLDSGQ